MARPCLAAAAAAAAVAADRPCQVAVAAVAAVAPEPPTLRAHLGKGKGKALVERRRQSQRLQCQPALRPYSAADLPSFFSGTGSPALTASISALCCSFNCSTSS